MNTGNIFRLLLATYLTVFTAGCNKPASNDTSAGNGTTSCSSSAVHVGFRIMQFAGGLKTAVWYPSSSVESLHSYKNGLSGSVAFNGVVGSGCGQVPLVVFSHGWSGCGTQSVYLTESLARAGYIVAAPDHLDAGCSVDNSPSGPLPPQTPSFVLPWTWDDTSYVDRRNDMENVLNGLLQNADFSPIIDQNKIGAMGHSLGGYTVLGMGGAWNSWKDARVKAVLALAPYLLPYLQQKTLSQINVPLMYQDDEGDTSSITKSLQGPTGAYAIAQPSKYYAEFPGGSHYEWTDLTCSNSGASTVSDCINRNVNNQLIVSYSISFFETHLRNNLSLVGLTGSGLVEYDHEP